MTELKEMIEPSTVSESVWTVSVWLQSAQADR